MDRLALAPRARECLLAPGIPVHRIRRMVLQIRTGLMDQTVGHGSRRMTPYMTVLKLKRGEERRIRAGHPWVFSNEVDTAVTPLSALAPGALVQVHSSRD